MISLVIGNPFPLKQNAGKSFQGSIVLGKGFVLSTEEAESLISKDQRNKDVIFPYLNGEDLNNDPKQRPSRWVINFFDWSEEKARSYPDCFALLEQRVKPERQRWKIDEKGNEVVGTYALRKPLPQKWWIYGEKRPALYETISKLDQVMVVPLVSKYSCFEFVPAKWVYMHKLGVLALTSFRDFGLLSSTIHSAWCWKNSSTLGAGTLNYSTTDCFETFPFPENLDGDILEDASQEYYSFRKKLMMDLQIGLTKLYNLFHDKDIRNNSWFRRHLEMLGNVGVSNVFERIETFRVLHMKVDNAVLKSYKWDDINLQHGFYELEFLPENDRIRFTINPSARKEILKRLLKKNHQLHGSSLPTTSGKHGNKQRVTKGSTPSLFNLE